MALTHSGQGAGNASVMLREILRAAELVRGKLNGRVPRLAAILGSGLGLVTDRFDLEVSIPYRELPGMPPTGVEGHSGELRIVRDRDNLGLLFCGRSHLYEGHPAWMLGASVRLAHALGARILVSTAAVGSFTPDLPSGSLAVIRDHINFCGVNPIAGVPSDAAHRFPDATHAYDAELRAGALAVVRRSGMICAEGIYAWVSGPSYETPAESRMMRALGADVVGMSLVPEVLTACQLGMRTLALACVTNLAPGIGDEPPSHERVLRAARQFSEPLHEILDWVFEAVHGAHQEAKGEG